MTDHPEYGEVDDICWKCGHSYPDAVTTDEDDFPFMGCNKGHCTNEGKETCEDFDDEVRP